MKGKKRQQLSIWYTMNTHAQSFKTQTRSYKQRNFSNLHRNVFWVEIKACLFNNYLKNKISTKESCKCKEINNKSSRLLPKRGDGAKSVLEKDGMIVLTAQFRQPLPHVFSHRGIGLVISLKTIRVGWKKRQRRRNGKSLVLFFLLILHLTNFL